MNLGDVFTLSCLSICGGCGLYSSFTFSRLSDTSLLSALKVSAIIFPLIPLLSRGSLDLMDELGLIKYRWVELSIIALSTASSFLLGSSSAVGLGLVPSLKTAFSASLIGINILLSAICFGFVFWEGVAYIRG